MDLENGKLNVVLVDDDTDDRMLFEEAFTELTLKCDLFMFANGMRAMEYFKRNETKIPHIIFLDLNMPMMGGLECLIELRKIEKYQYVPIAIYSTSNMDKDKEETLIAGANIYITKPTDYTQLKEILDRALKMQWQYHTSPLRIDNFVMVY